MSSSGSASDGAAATGDNTALVIGGSGFISSHCVHALLDAGYAVTVLSRGRNKDDYGDRVARIKCDTDDSKKFRKVLKTKGPWNVVVDCVCFDDDHATDVTTGLFPTDGEAQCKLFVTISTDSIYEVCQPPKKDRKRRENDDTLLEEPEAKLRKIDNYGYKKHRAETHFKRVASERDCNIVMLRLPDVVGENEVPTARHFEYQVRVMHRLPIDLSSQSKKPLSFVYAGDVGRVVVRLATLEPSVTAGQAFNIATEEVVTLEEYLNLIGETLGVAPNYSEEGSTGAYFPSVECGPIDISKAKEVLGFEPEPMSSWLPRTVKWFVEAVEDGRAISRGSREDLRELGVVGAAPDSSSSSSN